ncbi:MAG: serine/threonine-protein kinase [Acidobacteriota bacterium]|nr:serine/threonine-protein kinase [Acidobacteriota bacterium]
MDDQLWERADELLDQALEVPAAERPAFLERATEGNEELLALVQRLLSHLEEDEEELIPGLRLSAPAGAGLLDDDEPPPASPPGTVVGRYRLLGELGRGGMAVVYRAERIDGGFEQEVALKQILVGTESDVMVRRLEQERQILARATHPDMARLLDGGVDDQGRPYLVLELVDGVPIDLYCDHERLTVRQRLELFLRIAEAVAYAHRNLVVHRDIKPSNILVTGEGHPKLLDFGIARLLVGSEAEASLTVADHGLRPMTPAYASPEQVRSEPVTTLSDVYQLGLLLYLLLTGRTPYHRESSRSPLKLARAISEEPPAPLRKAFLEPTPEGPEEDTIATKAKIAAGRRTTPERLAKELGGDLSAIVLKALRKEPTRRYSSVEKMIEDLQRYLDGRTVAARPDSLAYRLRTFARRHSLAVTLGALLLSALIVFSVVTAVQARRIAAEAERANREAEVARQVSTFLTGLFEVSDPSEALGNTITAREILDRGSAEIDQRLAAPSLVRARLKRTMGQVYQNLGLFQEALPLFEAAVATATRVDGADSAEALAARSDLGGLLITLGRYDGAEELLQTTLAASARELGENHPQTLDLRANLASLRVFNRRLDEAERLFRQVWTTRRQVLGPRHEDTLATANSLGTVLFARGDLEGAEAVYRELLEDLRATLGSDHPHTLMVASNLGSVWIQLQRFDEARPLLRDTLERRTRVLGPDHPATFTVLSNLGGLLGDTGELEEAETLYRQVYQGRLDTVGPDHPKAHDALYDLGWLLSLHPDRLDESATYYRQALEGYEVVHGPDHPYVQDAAYQLALVEARRGEDEEALRLLETAVERGYRKEGVLDREELAGLQGREEMRALREVMEAAE